MKNRKDAKIEKLLSGVSEELKPSRSVTDKAKRYLAEQSERKQNAAESGGVSRVRNRKTGLRRFAYAMAVCAFVAVLSFGGVQFLRGIGDSVGGGQKPDAGGDHQPEIVNYYTSADIYTVSIGMEEIPGSVDMDWLDPETMSVTESREFRFKDGGGLAFLRFKIRMQGEESTDDLEVSIEVSKAVYEEFKPYSKLQVLRPESGVKGISVYVDGEYMSNAYFAENGAKFYINLISPEQDAFGRLLGAFGK